jgi:hypothetical protein
LIPVTMSGLFYRLSTSTLDLIRHVPFMRTGPYILRKIFLSQDMRAAVDFSVSVQGLGSFTPCYLSVQNWTSGDRKGG